MRSRCCKGASQRGVKFIIRRIVRPQRKHTAGLQVPGKPGKPLRRVQRGMARMQQVVRGVVDVHQHRIEAAAGRIGIEAIRGNQTSVDHMRDEFQRRRDVFVAGLNKIKGFSCRMPKGAFYAFPNITQTGLKSKPLADALLEQAGVAALSGTAFGEFGEGYLRFSIANSLENLQQALDRLDQWTKKNL